LATVTNPPKLVLHRSVPPFEFCSSPKPIAAGAERCTSYFGIQAMGDIFSSFPMCHFSSEIFVFVTHWVT
jgi:hypothetical protein